MNHANKKRKKPMGERKPRQVLKTCQDCGDSGLYDQEIIVCIVCGGTIIADEIVAHRGGHGT